MQGNLEKDKKWSNKNPVYKRSFRNPRILYWSDPHQVTVVYRNLCIIQLYKLKILLCDRKSCGDGGS